MISFCLDESESLGYKIWNVLNFVDETAGIFPFAGFGLISRVQTGLKRPDVRRN